MTEEYTNLDLETAEELLIGAGKAELVPALRAHAQGVRNLVQGEWGTSFVNSLESLLKTHIAPLTAEISGLRTEVATRLGKMEEGLTALNRRHGKQIRAIATRMDASEADRQSIHSEIADFREEFQRYIAGSKRAEFAEKIDDFERRIRALEARDGE